MSAERGGVVMCLGGIDMRCEVCVKSMLMYPECGTKTHLRRRYNATRQQGVAREVAWEYQKAGEGWTAFGGCDTGMLEEEYWRHATSVRPAATARACRQEESQVRSQHQNENVGLEPARKSRDSSQCKTEHGREVLLHLKEAMDKCLKWCEGYRESEDSITLKDYKEKNTVEDAAPVDAKDELSEQVKARAKAQQQERVVRFTDDTPPMGLLEWVESLPLVTPSLGYTPQHVSNLAGAVQKVLGGEEKDPQQGRSGREGERDKLAKAGAGEGQVEAGIAALALEGPREGVELFLAGVLYTADLTERVKQEDGKIKNMSVWLTDADILKNHGIVGKGKKSRLALYFVMNAAMREAPKCLKAHENSIYECTEQPLQFHVLRIFQSLIKRTAALVRLLPSEETTVFRGINVNVSTHYRVGSSVVWNGFTSTSMKRTAAMGFMDKGKT
eukprot:Hpha_TRINITY_DN16899_c4_g3::TRINITY_DN16899_c4_g3_i10::g.148732::m.148732